jgi:hypothetical protein
MFTCNEERSGRCIHHSFTTYRNNRINIKQDPNEWEENAHGDFRERNTYILYEYIRTYEQQVISYGCSIFRVDVAACAQTKQKIMTKTVLLCLLECNKRSFRGNDPFNENGMVLIVFSHRALKLTR